MQESDQSSSSKLKALSSTHALCCHDQAYIYKTLRDIFYISKCIFKKGQRWLDIINLSIVVYDIVSLCIITIMTAITVYYYNSILVYYKIIIIIISLVRSVARAVLCRSGLTD